MIIRCEKKYENNFFPPNYSSLLFLCEIRFFDLYYVVHFSKILKKTTHTFREIVSKITMHDFHSLDYEHNQRSFKSTSVKILYICNLFIF